MFGSEKLFYHNLPSSRNILTVVYETDTASTAMSTEKLKNTFTCVILQKKEKYCTSDSYGEFPEQRKKKVSFI